MPSIRCFMIEDTGILRRQLSRFSRAAKCPAYPDGNSFSTHRAVSAFRSDVPEGEHDEAEFLAEYPCDAPEWPASCVCGYRFANADVWNCAIGTLFRRGDTGETFQLRDAPVGAMWFMTWAKGHWNPQCGDSPLVVMTPGGDWMIDSQASNCTMKDDFNQERHHCWVAHGKVPNITVDKNGPTCQAGAGSIRCGSYHGFLRGGYLVEA